MAIALPAPSTSSPFNILLEASLPSLVSRLGAAASRGTALGVYNTTQALGCSSGGRRGLARRFGEASVFVRNRDLLRYGWERHGEMPHSGRIRRADLPGCARGADPVALRGELVRLRGVRRSGGGARRRHCPTNGVYPESFDEAGGDGNLSGGEN